MDWFDWVLTRTEVPSQTPWTNASPKGTPLTGLKTLGRKRDPVPDRLPAAGPLIRPEPYVFDFYCGNDKIDGETR
jgi:hypothetical protein